MNHRRWAALLVAISSAATLLPQAWAITDEEIFRKLRFNFINPGGRALGLGGSFIALADDATAAQANPAGLTQLAAPEFFLEQRYLGGDSESSTAPAFGGSGSAFSASNERRAISTPTFVSWVLPRKHFAVGLSRQEVLATRISASDTFTFDPGFGAVTWAGAGEAAVEVTNWNVALAWRPVEWISAGVTGSFGDMHIDYAVTNTISDPQGLFLCGAGFDCSGGPPPPLQNPQAWYATRADDDDSQFTYSVGLVVTPMEKIAVGLVYRADTEYEYEAFRVDGLSSSNFTGFSKPTATFTDTLHLPSSYGLGVKWRPANNWTFVADAVRINYTDLLDGLRPQENVLTGVVNEGTTSNPDFQTQYDVDDVTEIHAGAEYLFSGGKIPWAVRVGAYTDPDNAVRDANPAQGFGAVLEGRDDEVHGTVGVGFVFQEKFQVDAALSLSGIGTEGVVSFIYRF